MRDFFKIEYALQGKVLFNNITVKLENILPSSQTGGCFTKGTRVHTKDGLKPIEQIQVGDYVLSSPEDGSGSPEYKRVLKTFVHEQKTIVHISIQTSDGRMYSLAATGNHPFWIEGIGWTRADILKEGNVLRMADGSRAEIVRQKHVYRTGNDGIGWVADTKNIEEGWGSLFDYANHALVPDSGHAEYLPREVYESGDLYLQVRVYNLEVEDYHTYYVGAGVWVHQTN